jgi:hypothetical protein
MASAIGKGTITLKGSVDGKLVTILLTDVLHIPEACTNLVSHAQLDKRGVSAEFPGSGCLLLSLKGQAIISGTLENDLYKLDLMPCKGLSVTNISEEYEDTHILAAFGNNDLDFTIADWDMQA